MRRHRLADIKQPGGRDRSQTRPSHMLSLVTPVEKPRSPSKNSTVEFLGMQMKAPIAGKGGILTQEPGSALRTSNHELELRLVSDADAFDVQTPMNALSDSGELITTANGNEDLRLANIDEPEIVLRGGSSGPNGGNTRLTVLK